MSRRSAIRAAVAAAAIALGLAMGASSASAAQTFGSDLTLTPETTPANCAFAPPGSCSSPTTTFLVAGYHTGNTHPASSPISGVVVSFSAKAGAPETINFRLGQVGGGVTAPGTASATGPTAVFSSAGTLTVPARVPVQAGDLVGFDFATTGGDAFVPTTGCTGIAGGFGYNPALVDGAAPQDLTYTSSCERLVNATVEADADNDGFGDETQDRCLGTAGTDNGCPPSPSQQTPPSTTTPPPPCAGKTGLALKRCRCKHKSTKAARKKCLRKVNAAARKD